jgi:nucleoside-diphosphate-sugar epimerase
MTTELRIALAGASRGVGREIARCLQSASYSVTALVRSNAARADLEAMGLQVIVADALDADAVNRALSACAPVDVVISTIGGVPQDGGERSDYLGNRNLIDGAVQTGVPRFILVTSIGSAESAVALPPQVLQVLGPVLLEKEQAEQHLIASGLTYTIIRPGGLKSEPATGQGVLTADPTVAGPIHRADVAELVCRCLASDRAQNRILSAVDRQMVYGERSIEEFEV